MKKPFLIVYSVLLCCELYAGNCFAEPNLITFSNIDKAWKYSQGQNTKVAVLDWLFDMSPKASDKYVNPTSMVPGKPVGSKKPWHGEWMAEIVHQIAPGAKIIPIRARTGKDSLDEDGRQEYEKYLVKGIRFAADQGAVAVTNSMGRVTHCKELEDAIDYAEQKGTVFIDVHPERIVKGTQTRESNNRCDHRIIHTGVVSVPKYPTKPKARRDIYVWPYKMNPVYKDGWGYSNGPPIVAGVIALMKSANPYLSPKQVRTIIAETACIKEGFKVLDAEAAVRKAIELKTNSHEPNEPNQPAYLKVIPPQKLKEDLDFLFKTIEEVHPNMYAYTPKKEFIPIRDELYSQINRPMTRLNFLKLVVPTIALLKSNHTIMFPPLPPAPSELTDFIQNGGKFFPLSIDWYGEKVILSENYTSEKLPLGGTILQINGEDISKVIKRLENYYSAEGKDTCPAALEKDKAIRFLFWLEYGSIETLKLRIKAVDGTINDYIVEMMTFGQLKAKEDTNKGINSYRYLPECDTFYIKLDDWACWSRIKEFTEFCDGVFKEVQKKKGSNLIIDLRNNPGGDLLNTEVFTTYLIKNPNLSFEGAIPLTVKKHHPFYRENNPLIFTGSVYLLIGEISTSASTVFAGIIKNHPSATIIGQEPIEPLTFYGGTTNFKLPNTGLLLSVPQNRFVVPGSKNDGRSIIPDYEVKQKPEDTAKGVDTVLQFTLDLIEKEQRKREIKEKQE
jgi:hypothetical protein